MVGGFRPIVVSNSGKMPLPHCGCGAVIDGSVF